MIPQRCGIGDLPDAAQAATLRLDDAGAVVPRLLLVDLDRPVSSAVIAAALTVVPTLRGQVLVGVAARPIPAELHPLVDALDLTVVAGPATRRSMIVADGAELEGAVEAVVATVRTCPVAALTLAELLRQTAVLDVRSGLAAESAAYSMLLAGPEFRSWRAARPVRTVTPAGDPAVVLTREGEALGIEVNRPARHNAFDRTVRDGLAEAFDLVLADASITRVELRGRGASFGSGGDLDEFGTLPDPGVAHAIRLDRSVGARIAACRERVTSHLHGACIGAGIELPAFGAHVHASPDTVIRLPELAMGLVPGAGGTVSLTARIGRWRTAYLALTGAPLDLRTALSWGLVDRIVDLERPND